MYHPIFPHQENRMVYANNQERRLLEMVNTKRFKNPWT